MNLKAGGGGGGLLYTMNTVLPWPPADVQSQGYCSSGAAEEDLQSYMSTYSTLCCDRLLLSNCFTYCSEGSLNSNFTKVINNNTTLTFANI